MKQITNEQFDEYLNKIVSGMTASSILSYGDVYTALSEHLNNSVIEAWEEENQVKRRTFSAMWSDKLGAAILENNSEPYPMEFHQGGDDFNALVAAVNQGIDSHLQAVHFTESAGSNGRRKFTVTPETLPVLVRRLMEADDEASNSLASTICETINIELV